ncbi:hypothetical protein E4U43_006438, partial [Claviceps pusilla]
MWARTRAVAQRAARGTSRLSLTSQADGRFLAGLPHHQHHGHQTAADVLVNRPDRSHGTLHGISWTREHILLQQQHGNGGDGDGDGNGNGNGPRILRPATLRDGCACSACRDASSGQKTFASVEIPPDIGIAAVRSTGQGLGITFCNEIARFAREGHEMILPWASVRRMRASSSSSSSSSCSSPSSPSSSHKQIQTSLSRRKQAILGLTGVQYWDASILAQHVRKIDYHAFMQDDDPSSPSSAFWDVIVDLLRLGIVYLHNVPRHEASIVHITTRIANIRETFYGRTFDVRAKPRAENVAYTSGHLGLHQDLCYLSPPPMVQVLHCMDNSCAGGESLFSDGERAGRLLWPFVSGSESTGSTKTTTETGNKMAVLADHALPYQYDKHGYFYHAARSVLHGHYAHQQALQPSFGGVYWSPPFQGRHYDDSAPDRDTSAAATLDLREWIPPARIFDGLINHPDAVHTYKMRQGECVLFDNLRVMHGRNAFDASAGGSRWLRGAYISEEDFLSRAA